MSFETFRETAARMRAGGMLRPGGQLIAHHMSHSGNPIHEELEAIFAPDGVGVRVGRTTGVKVGMGVLLGRSVVTATAAKITNRTSRPIEIAVSNRARSVRLNFDSIAAR